MPTPKKTPTKTTTPVKTPTRVATTSATKRSAPRAGRDSTDTLASDATPRHPKSNDDDEYAHLQTLEDLKPKKKRGSHKDLASASTVSAPWTGVRGIYTVGETVELEALIASVPLKKFKGRQSNKEMDYNWSDFRTRLRREDPGFLFVQPTQTEFSLSQYDMELVPFFLILGTKAATEEEAIAQAPTHYVAKQSPIYSDPEDNCPLSYLPLVSLGVKWVRVADGGKPLRVFALCEMSSSTSALSGNAGTSFSFGPVATNGTSHLNTFGFGNSGSGNGGTSANGQPGPIPFGFGFGSSASSNASAPPGPIQFSFGNAATAPTAPVAAFTFGASNSTTTTTTTPTTTATVVTASSFLPPAGPSNATPSVKFHELPLAIWDPASLKESVRQWKSGMKVVIQLPSPVGPFHKLTMESDRDPIETTVEKNIERVFIKQNKACKGYLAWRDAYPLDNATVYEVLNKDFAKLLKREKESDPQWAELWDKYGKPLTEAFESIVQQRRAVADHQISLVQSVIEQIQKGTVPSLHDWHTIKFCPQRDDKELPFQVAARVPGLGLMKECVPEAHKTINPFTSEVTY